MHGWLLRIAWKDLHSKWYDYIQKWPCKFLSCWKYHEMFWIVLRKRFLINISLDLEIIIPQMTVTPYDSMLS